MMIFTRSFIAIECRLASSCDPVFVRFSDLRCAASLVTAWAFARPSQLHSRDSGGSRPPHMPALWTKA
jgi:hypothetical protein